MSRTVRFHVLNIEKIHAVYNELPVIVTLDHFGNSNEVVEQIYGDNPSIKSREIPQDVYLWDSDSEAETFIKRTDSYGNTLRYTTAKKLSKLRLPNWTGAFDKAMMSYIKTLAKSAPKTIVVLEMF